MNYNCQVKREVKDGKLVHLYLGIPEADAYLRFLKHRRSPDIWISYGYV